MPSSWSKPLPFIKSIGNRFVINEETAKLLKEIDKPIIPVAIAGVYRTGKSYLLNFLARKCRIVEQDFLEGFPIGSSVEATTTGIWLWCCDHPRFPDKALLLLDTEGLSDPMKDNEYDMATLTLIMLLCTMFIFNGIGKIDQQMINNLYFVTELTDYIKVRAAEDDEEVAYSEFAEHFPCFVLVVRDFMLNLVMNGEEISADQYFEQILRLREGSSRTILNYNLPREAIQSAFRSRHCFVLPCPVNIEEQFRNLDQLCESDLSRVFLAQAETFCDFVLQNSNEKLIHGRSNGRLFLGLTEQYTECINKREVPCIESTITLVAEKENGYLQEESIKFYGEEMNQIALPAIQDDLAAAHTVACSAATQYFNGNVVFDGRYVFTDNLLKNIEAIYAEILTKNNDASTTSSKKVLVDLYRNIIGKKMAKKEYICPGGHKKYEVDMEELKNSYNGQQGKMVMADVVYDEFVKSKQNEVDIISSADTTLSDQEKEIKAAQKAKVDAEAKAQLSQQALDEMAAEYKALEQQHKMRVKEVQDATKLLEELVTERKPTTRWETLDIVPNLVYAFGIVNMGVTICLDSIAVGVKKIEGWVLWVLEFFRTISQLISRRTE